MSLSRKRMLDLMQERNEAYDGRFLTGVVTTGIYCLPSCKAKKPRAENVLFFPSPERARQAGLRACKRCRPDDFYLRLDPEQLAVEELVTTLRRRPGGLRGGADLAAALGVGPSKLHELFRRHYHTSPARLITRARVDAARRLLLESDRGVLDLALEVGFESLSAFNANFRRLTGMAPSDYRRLRGARGFAVRLPSSFPVARTLAYLGRDPGSVSERVAGGRYAAAMRLDGAPARLEVELAAGWARCSLDGPRRLPDSAATRAHELVLRRLGLTGDVAGFESAVAARPRLAPLVDGRRGLRLPLTAEPFEALLWAILGQQVNLPFARTMLRRLVERAGAPVGEGLSALPEAAAVADLDAGELRAMQLSRQKIDYLSGAARQVAAGGLDLAGLAAGSATRAEQALSAVRGLGPWSVGYVMMRGLGFADCVPVGDSGLNRALEIFFALDGRPSAAETRELMEPFRPHRSLATFHLWQLLEENP